jgi:dTDP-4-amino-4,6-dideoxygalactose transaminase
MSKQPFLYERYCQGSFPNSNLVHELGIYVPNNHQLESEEIKLIVEVINKSI